MNIIKIEKNNLVNGDGMRCVVWCSGCFWNCDKCHNAETHDPNFGTPFNEDHYKQIKEQLDKREISGVTLTGGDPFNPHNRDGMAELCKRIRAEYPNKTIWCYTGYVFEDITDTELIKYVDVLIDGKYIDALNPKVRALLWRGSSNQRIIDVPKSLLTNKVELLYKD